VSKSGDPPERIQEPEWIRDEEFAKIFEESDCLPRVVFLHLCEGGKGTTQGRIGGVAPNISALGVPTVVAMQYPITQAVAGTFSQSFYRAIGRAATVDEAVQLGRAAIAEDRTLGREFGTPVVYISTHDLLLLQKPLAQGSGGSENDLVRFQDVTKWYNFARAKEGLFIQAASKDLFKKLLTSITQSNERPRSALTAEIYQLFTQLTEVRDSVPDEEFKQISDILLEFHSVVGGK